MNTADIEQYKKAWAAISDIYLDIDLRYLEFKSIAKKLLETDFTEKQLNDIYYYDIAPVCHINGIDPAGEWVEFDREWLFSEILKNRKKNQKLFRLKCKLLKRFYLMGTEEDWFKVLEKLRELRSQP